MEKPKTLSAAFVRTVSRPGRFGDGRGSHGLYLRVHQTANGRISRNWCQRIRITGKPTNLGLGSYPLVTLAAARAKALENASAVADGRDPRETPATIPTFADAAEIVIGIHSEGWRNPKTEKQWQSSLDAYAMPVLGTKPVAQITTADILECLLPIWITKKDLAPKIRQRIGAVMRWAVAQGFRADDPTGKALGDALPKTGRTQHHRALPFAEVAAAIERVRATDAWPATKLAFELLILTATRSGETRLATWDEIDFDCATWSIPAARMKADRDHRVPLSRQAVDVLWRAKARGDGTGLVFPSPRGKVLSDSTLSKLVRENGISAVPHGFRSSFRDWAAEKSDVPREIAEHALAHVEGSTSELAYRRTDYFERRRGLMQDWADYVLG
jgi:integrase